MITFWLNIFGIYTIFEGQEKANWHLKFLLLATQHSFVKDSHIISAYQTDHCAPLQRKLKIFSKMKINHGKFSFCWVSFKASFLLGRDEAKEMHWALEKINFCKAAQLASTLMMTFGQPRT